MNTAPRPARPTSSRSFQSPRSHLPSPAASLCFQSLTNCLRFATHSEPLSFQPITNCPFCKSFVLKTIQHAGGVGGPSISSKVPYILPSSVCAKPFVSHSYENCRGVYPFFPFWFTPSLEVLAPFVPSFEANSHPSSPACLALNSLSRTPTFEDYTAAILCAQRLPRPGRDVSALSFSDLFHRYLFSDHRPRLYNSFRINTCKTASKQTTLSTFRINTSNYPNRKAA